MQGLRFGQRRGADMLSVLAVNYVVAFLVSLSVFLIRLEGWDAPLGGLPLAMGAVNGVLFVWSIPFLLGGFGTAGVGVTTATLRAASIIPVLVSWYAFGESMNQYRWIAVALLLPAMILIRPRDPTRPHLTLKTDLFLLVLFLNAGCIQTTHKLADINLDVSQQDFYKMVIFGIAAMILAGILLAKRRVPTVMAVGLGIVVGIVNAGTVFSLLMALHRIPAVIFFPSVSSLTILINVIVSWRLWQETLLRRQVGGIALAIAILCLVNMG